jgi:hypothetical protein
MSTIKVIVRVGRTDMEPIYCDTMEEAEAKKDWWVERTSNDPAYSVRIENLKATENVLPIKHNDRYADLHTVALGACGFRVGKMSRYGR